MSDNQKRAWDKYPVALPKDTILAGRYIIKDVLGQGGFGITYLAEDHKTGTKAAVKEFFPETMVTRQTEELEVRTYTDERLDNFRFGMASFLDEAKMLAQFKENPHIVGVQKYFEENGTAYFVMDYIEGIDFKTFIQKSGGKLSWEEVWRIMSPIMEALDAVHRKGLVHRDVTPDNIFIANDGTVKLIDFGAARYSLGDRSQSLDVVLKHGYAPKEQYTRRGKQGPFTDVYSVAACFYAALSGYLPPESLDRMEEDNLLPLSRYGVRVPKSAEAAILKGLEVRAEDRFQNMWKFMQAITGEIPKMGGVHENRVKVKADKAVNKLKKAEDRNEVFGNKKIDRSFITAVSFTNTQKNVPADAWDASEEQNGTVMAWTKPDGRNIGFNLYIAANGNITINSAVGMFENYRNVKEILFNQCFDTSQIADMSYMFYGCTALENLDLGGFDTSQTTNMTGMFVHCDSLKSLDLSGFNTERVVDMGYMFFCCNRLENLYIDYFDTRQVTDMRYMFFYCSSLQSLNLSVFDMRLAHDTNGMFSYSGISTI